MLFSRNWLRLALTLAVATGIQAEVPADSAWVDAIRASLAEREYHASRKPQGLQAPNRAHRLRSRFGPAGLSVVDRTASGEPELLALRLARLGRGVDLTGVPEGVVSHEGARVEIERSALGLVEWFQNSAAGLEQGFTLQRRPTGSGALRLEVEVSHAAVEARGDGLRFRSETGRRLDYTKLLVLDANGERVVSRFDFVPDGFVILVDDADAAYPLVVDPLLTATVDTVLDGVDANDDFGISVSGAGDVNGDGFGDVIVGALFYDGGEPSEGGAFIFHGSATGIADQGGAAADTILLGDQEGCGFGRSVAGAGDVNGDGFDDVIVGADDYDNGENNEGAAFLFYGSASGVPSQGAPVSGILEADQTSAGFGISVAGAGDVNGDGFADVIVGAPNFTSSFGLGTARIFHGSASGIGPETAGNAAWTLDSIDATASLFGQSVASAGDVNGDGFADVIVGGALLDNGAANEGQAFVFHGRAGVAQKLKTSDADATLESNQPGAAFGFDVASAGDVNGDGYADVMVGAIFYSDSEASEGAAWIFHGSPSGVTGTDPSNADTEFQSDQANAVMSGVAGAGDVNGDGYADVIVGASGYDADESNEGAAFVFLGRAGGIPDGTPATAYAQLEFDEVEANLGSAVASAGDVNGDGYSDVIAGAVDHAGGAPDSGGAFLWLGGAAGIADGNPLTANTLIDANSNEAALGFLAASAGDVNGDGFGDVIVGAPQYDASGFGSRDGAAFIFHGSATGIADASATSADTVLLGNDFQQSFGVGVDAAGDVNGDGYGDVIVGASGFDQPGPNQGAAFLYLGGPGGIPSGDPNTADTILLSDQPSLFGGQVAAAGDVDGDGYGDILIADHLYDAGQSDEAAAFLFRGSATGIASGDAGDADHRFETNQTNGSTTGLIVSTAGDVNGDGFDDVVIGASTYETTQSFAGAAWILHGSASGLSGTDPTSADTELLGDQFVGAFADYVSFAGDVNGDGFDDVILGAPGYDNASSDGGSAFLYLGSGSGIPDGGPGDADTQIDSDQNQASLGGSVGAAGDLNGDGFDDVVISAPFYDQGSDDEGIALVYLGSATGIASGTSADADTLLQSDQQAAGMGSVGTAGDVNGDGFGDLYVGVPAYSHDLVQIGAEDVFEGILLLYHGNHQLLGRTAHSQQRRGDGSGNVVHARGAWQLDDGFEARLFATSPRGRERARLEVETCPEGTPFGDASCLGQVGASWTDLGLTGATLSETISGLSNDTSYRWRARVHYAPFRVTEAGITAPPNPRHGPWRRLQGSGWAGNDVRMLPEPGAIARVAAGALLFGLLRHRRGNATPEMAPRF